MQLMSNVPLTLSNAFDFGLAATREIFKNETEGKRKEAELDFAIHFLQSIGRRRVWAGHFFI